MFERGQFSPRPLHKEPSRVGRMGTVLLAGGVALTGSAAVGAGLHFSGDPLLIPRHVGEAIFDPDCPPTDEVKVKVVKDELSRIPTEAESVGFDGYKNFVLDAARKNGLTLFDTSPYLASLNEAKSVEEVMTVWNYFTSNFGIDIEITEERDIKDTFVPFQPVFKDDIDFGLFQEGAKHFIYNFEYVPEEVVRTSGVQKIKIVHSELIPDPKNPGEYIKYFDGLHNSTTNIMYLDILGLNNGGNTPLHELGHGFDAQYCRQLEVDKDTQYDSRNPSEFDYGEGVDTNYQVTLSEYTATGIKEDKAETFATFLTLPHIYPHLEKPLRDKIDLLVARLDAKVPGVAKFYAAIAGKDF